MVTNQGHITNIAANPTSNLVDGTDAIHTGIIKTLNVGMGQNRLISTAEITQGTTSSYTHYEIEKTNGGDNALMALRDGIVISVPNKTITTHSPAIAANASGGVDWYGLIVIVDGSNASETANTLYLRKGIVTGNANTTVSTVAELKDGDIPIVLVKYVAGSTTSATDRPIQWLTGNIQTSRGFSAINNGSETFKINPTGTVVVGSATITYPASTGTLARTADVAYSSAISSGNSGLVPSVGTAGHFLRHDGTFGIPAYIANTDTNTNQLTTWNVGVDTNTNTTTIAHGETLTFTGGTGISTTTTADGTITFVNTSPDVNHNTDTQLTEAQVLAKTLTGLDVTQSTTDIAATDTIIAALGHMEKRIRLNDDKVTDVNHNTDVDVSKTILLTRLGSYNSTETVNIGDGDADTTVNIRGNLNVTGTTTTLNATEIDVLDAMVFTYDSGSDGFDTTLRITEPTAARVITLPDATGTLAFENAGTTGNAATATALENARNIGGVSFDGTSDINLAGVNIAGNQSTSGNAATATLAATATNVTITNASADSTYDLVFESLIICIVVVYNLNME